MTQVLEKWLNDELQLSSKLNILSFHEDFSDGYLFGEILHRIGRQPDFQLFKRSQDSDVKLANFARLGLTLHLIGIDISLNDIRLIAEEKNRLKTVELLYKLYVQLHRNDIDQQFSAAATDIKKSRGTEVSSRAKPLQLSLQELKDELAKKEALSTTKQTLMQAIFPPPPRGQVSRSGSADGRSARKKRTKTHDDAEAVVADVLEPQADSYAVHDKQRVDRFIDRYDTFCRQKAESGKRPLPTDTDKQHFKRPTLKEQADQQLAEFENEYKDMPKYMAAGVAPHQHVLPPRRIMNKRLRMVTHAKRIAKAAHDVEVNQKTAEDVHEGIHEFEMRHFMRRHVRRKSSAVGTSVDGDGQDEANTDHAKSPSDGGDDEGENDEEEEDDDDEEKQGDGGSAPQQTKQRKRNAGAAHQPVAAQFSDSPPHFPSSPPNYETSINNRAYIEQIRERVEKDALVQHEMEHRHHKIWLELARAKREQQHTLRQDAIIEHILQRTRTYRNAADRMLTYRRKEHVRQMSRMATMRQNANQRNADYVEVMLREGLWQLPSAAVAAAAATQAAGGGGQRPGSAPGAYNIDALSARAQAYKWCSEAGFSDNATNVCLPLLAKYARMGQQAQKDIEKEMQTSPIAASASSSGSRKRLPQQSGSARSTPSRAHTAASTSPLNTVDNNSEQSKIKKTNSARSLLVLTEEVNGAGQEPTTSAAASTQSTAGELNSGANGEQQSAENAQSDVTKAMLVSESSSKSAILTALTTNGYRASDQWRHPRLLQYHNILQRWCAKPATHPSPAATTHRGGSVERKSLDGNNNATSATTVGTSTTEGSGDAHSNNNSITTTAGSGQAATAAAAACTASMHTDLNAINPLYFAQPRAGEIITGLVNHVYLANNRHACTQKHKFPQQFLSLLFVGGSSKPTYPSRMTLKMAQRLEAKYGLKCVDVNVLVREAIAAFILQQEVLEQQQQQQQNDENSVAATKSPRGTVQHQHHHNIAGILPSDANNNPTTLRPSKGGHRASVDVGSAGAVLLSSSVNAPTVTGGKLHNTTNAATKPTNLLTATGGVRTSANDQRQSVVSANANNTSHSHDNTYATNPPPADGFDEIREQRLQSLNARAEIGRRFVEFLDQADQQTQNSTTTTAAHFDPQLFIDLIIEAIDRQVIEPYRADYKQRLYHATLSAASSPASADGGQAGEPVGDAAAAAAADPTGRGAAGGGKQQQPATAATSAVAGSGKTAAGSKPAAVAPDAASAGNNKQTSGNVTKSLSNARGAAADNNATASSIHPQSSPHHAPSNAAGQQRQQNAPPPYTDDDFYIGWTIVNLPLTTDNAQQYAQQLETSLACVHASQWSTSSSLGGHDDDNNKTESAADSNEYYEWVDVPSRPRCYHKKPTQHVVVSAVDIVAMFETGEPPNKYFAGGTGAERTLHYTSSSTLPDVVKHMKKERIKAGLPSGTGTVGINMSRQAVPAANTPTTTTAAITAVPSAVTVSAKPSVFENTAANSGAARGSPSKALLSDAARAEAASRPNVAAAADPQQQLDDKVHKSAVHVADETSSSPKPAEGQPSRTHVSGSVARLADIAAEQQSSPSGATAGPVVHSLLEPNLADLDPLKLADGANMTTIAALPEPPPKPRDFLYYNSILNELLQLMFKSTAEQTNVDEAAATEITPPDLLQLTRKLQSFYVAQSNVADIDLVVLEDLPQIRTFYEQLKTHIRRRIGAKWQAQRDMLAFRQYCHTTAAACAQQLWLSQTQARKQMLLPYAVRIHGTRALDYLHKNDVELCANLQRVVEAKLLRVIKMCLNGCYGDYVCTAAPPPPPTVTSRRTSDATKTVYEVDLALLTVPPQEHVELTHPEPLVVQLRYTLHKRSSSGVVNVLAGEHITVPTTTVRVVVKSVGRQLLHRSLMMDTSRLPDSIAAALSQAWAQAEELLLKDVVAELERSDEIGQAFEHELERMQAINAFVCSRRNTVLSDTFRDWTATYNAFILPVMADEGFCENDGAITTSATATSASSSSSTTDLASDAKAHSTTSGNVSSANEDERHKNSVRRRHTKKAAVMPDKAQQQKGRPAASPLSGRAHQQQLKSSCKVTAAAAASSKQQQQCVAVVATGRKSTPALEQQPPTASQDRRTFLADLNVLRYRCVESCDWRREECFRILLELMRDEQQFNHILRRLFNHGLRLVECEMRHYTRVLRFLFVYFKQLFSVASTEHKALTKMAAAADGAECAVDEATTAQRDLSSAPVAASRTEVVNQTTDEISGQSPPAQTSAIKAKSERSIASSKASATTRPAPDPENEAESKADSVSPLSPTSFLIDEIVNARYPLFDLLTFQDSYNAQRSVEDFIYGRDSKRDSQATTAANGKRFKDVTNCTAEQLTRSLGKQEDQMRYLRLVDDDFWPVIMGVTEYEGLRLMTRMRAELVEHFHNRIEFLLDSSRPAAANSNGKSGNENVSPNATTNTSAPHAYFADQSVESVDVSRANSNRNFVRYADNHPPRPGSVVSADNVSSAPATAATSTAALDNVYVGPTPPTPSPIAAAAALRRLQQQQNHLTTTAPAASVRESDSESSLPPPRVSQLSTTTARRARVSIPRQLLIRSVGMDINPYGRLYPVETTTSTDTATAATADIPAAGGRKKSVVCAAPEHAQPPAASKSLAKVKSAKLVIDTAPTKDQQTLLDKLPVDGVIKNVRDENSSAFPPSIPEQPKFLPPIRSADEALKLHRLSQSLTNRFMRAASSELRATRGRVKAVRGETSRVCESFKTCIRQLFFELDRQVEQVYVDEILAVERFFKLAVDALDHVRPLPETFRCEPSGTED